MRIRLLALALSASSLLGCGDDGLFSFRVTDDIDESTVEGSPLGVLTGDLFEVPIPLNLDIEAETASRSTGPASGVFLTALSLSITDTAMPSGDEDNFDFIDSVEVRVEASDGSLDSQVIATLEGAQDGSSIVRFNVDESVDLLPYVEAGARLTSSAEGTAPPDDTSFDGSLTLRIQVL